MGDLKNKQRLNLPLCVGESTCTCFNSLYSSVESNSTKNYIFEYILHQSKEIANYLELLQQHVTKDKVLKENQYSHVPAFEVKEANDRFRTTVHRLRQFETVNTRDTFFCFVYFNNFLFCKQLTALYDNIAETQDLSLKFLNKPNSLIPLHTLIEILNLHQICLYILQQLFHLIVYGRPLHLNCFPYINVKNFSFQ